MANRIIGMNGSMGAPAMPRASLPQPHWNTATTTP